jgi:hypothetical protein
LRNSLRWKEDKYEAAEQCMCLLLPPLPTDMIECNLYLVEGRGEREERGTSSSSILASCILFVETFSCEAPTLSGGMTFTRCIILLSFSLFQSTSRPSLSFNVFSQPTYQITAPMVMREACTMLPGCTASHGLRLIAVSHPMLLFPPPPPILSSCLTPTSIASHGATTAS